ncbi:MAG: F0F1 ATP synthase subunit epsilon [Alphaproteobacteria bacterium]|nr:F0F1 ATP synthase subunit epsilon [Alphaproteobacteria bacterium]
MRLKILLPFRVFATVTSVSRIVAETSEGSIGLLPHRLDCVASLVPGILEYETQAKQIAYVALDEGVMIKTGADVLVSVRRAIAGSDLSQLHKQVEQEFLTLSSEEEATRSVMAKLEVGFLHRLASLHHD